MSRGQSTSRPSVTGHLGLGTVPLAPTRGHKLTAHLGPHLLDPSSPRVVSPRAQPPGTTFPRPLAAPPARPMFWGGRAGRGHRHPSLGNAGGSDQRLETLSSNYMSWKDIPA